MAGTLVEKFREIDKRGGWMVLFAALRQESAKSLPTYNDAKSAANARLNRYRDVLPFDHSRVRLGDDDGYINASHVPIPDAERSYILTQGPLAHTTGDFWRMVWEQKSSAIVMLNRITEKGQVKCHLYYPTNEEDIGHASKSVRYGDYEVELASEQATKHYIVRKFRLTNAECDECREITHFQFITWPDFGVPESTSDFLEFLLEVRRSGLLNYRQYGPPVVHCSAGVGRSGTFVIADAALVIAHKTKEPSKLDIVQMVLDLRYFRMGLIQTHEQLRFSWKAVIDALEEDRWTELIETTCCADDQCAAPSSSGPVEVKKSKRPSLKRLSGNQLTDDSSDTETGSNEGEEGTSTSSPMTTRPNVSAGMEKSPKRPRPDNQQIRPVNGIDTSQEEGDVVTNKERANCVERDEPTSSGSVERYEARLRRRHQRALEVQKKIDKIHENLRRSNSIAARIPYTNWLYGGAVVVFGGVLVYLYSRWGY